MNLAWTKNLRDPEEQTKFINQIRSSTDVLNRQKELLLEQLETLEKSEASLSTYDTPSWSAKQAHINGDRSRIMWMLRLIDLDQQK